MSFCLQAPLSSFCHGALGDIAPRLMCACNGTMVPILDYEENDINAAAARKHARLQLFSPA